MHPEWSEAQRSRRDRSPHAVSPATPKKIHLARAKLLADNGVKRRSHPISLHQQSAIALNSD
ncbi:hypothetical protein NDI49_04145 [Trichocoleus sp. ST-U3]|uniref:hypothetical protein n=1 Tax=Coleofasciculus sp. FACHB-542 TaxID=2692787 RepID=UPI001687ABF8|nr:hypothetical protein [Coleofasciculus sp. FACHB-542]MBD2086815.1 hypothetical protein [Coleofasciculus sp. FACHB-542]